MFYEHGKILGVSLTHVQPTFTLHIVPQAAKKLDTPPTADHNHDKYQLQNSPHTVQTNTTVEELVVSIPDTVQTNTTVEELVVSIPIHFQLQNEDTNIETNNFTFISPQTLNETPEQIEFPPEYFTQGENDQTSSDNETEEYDYIIQTETNENPLPVQYPIVNYDKDIELKEDIDNGWVKVENDELPDHCHFIGNKGLNMNTTSCNPEDFSTIYLMTECTQSWLKKQTTMKGSR